MAEYIDKQAFLEEQRNLYCENCEKRKGIKRGKMRFVYEIGDAPCRSCGYGDVLDDLEDLPAADVRPAVRAAWEDTPNPQWPAHSIRHCPCCGWSIPKSKLLAKDSSWNYCPNCGADMREES